MRRVPLSFHVRLPLSWLLLAAATLPACGTPALTPTGVRTTAGVAQARAFDLAGTVRRLVEDAQGADLEAIEQSRRTLHELSLGLSLDTSKDLADVLLFTRAHRTLIHEAAKHGDTWMPVAFALSNDVGRTLDTLTRTLRGFRPGTKRDPLVDYGDVVAVLDEGADAMLDRFPTPPPAVIAREPDWAHPEAGYRFIATYGSLGLEASRLVRTEQDVAAFQGALDRMVAKATGMPDFPRSLVARLAQWAEGYRHLVPKGPKAFAESRIAL